MNEDMLFDLIPYTRGVCLDLSAGTKTKPFEYMLSSWDNRLDITDLSIFADRSVDSIYSANYLGGCKRSDKEDAVRKWLQKLKDGGFLCIAWETGQIPEGECEEIMRKCAKGYELLIRKDYPNGVTLHVYKKRMDGVFLLKPNKPIPDNAVCVIRYGAIGDCIVASSILPGLKEQGKYVVFNAQQGGHHILKHDPHIDEFLLMDKNQIPMSELTAYWAYLARKYPKIINLSETMEGAICSVPSRSEFTWPNETRRRYRGHNYYEFCHSVAGVPLPPRPGVFLTDEERKIAAKRRRDLGDKFVIVWTLSGSAKHKQTWQQDFVLGIPGKPGILQKYPNVHVIFVGDEVCRFLESGWENHPQVTCTAGKWTVRETLAMLEQADLVVGPETGIVNAAGIMGVPTMVFLSHTSEETLCKYWPDYTAIKPVDTECFPCYRLQYTEDTCNFVVLDEATGAKCPKCVANISVECIAEAIEQRIRGRNGN